MASHYACRLAQEASGQFCCSGAGLEASARAEGKQSTLFVRGWGLWGRPPDEWGRRRRGSWWRAGWDGVSWPTLRRIPHSHLQQQSQHQCPVHSHSHLQQHSRRQCPVHIHTCNNRANINVQHTKLKQQSQHQRPVHVHTCNNRANINVKYTLTPTTTEPTSVSITHLHQQ